VKAFLRRLHKNLTKGEQVFPEKSRLPRWTNTLPSHVSTGKNRLATEPRTLPKSDTCHGSEDEYSVCTIEEGEKSRLTHLDEHGRPHMVDVGNKPVSSRTAEAEGWVVLDKAICDILGDRGYSKKGDVLRIAETAGIMAVKRTWELIPLCHALRIDSVRVKCDLLTESKKIHIKASVTAHDVTGVEMEALTGVSIAALTVYDMCKAVSKGMVIEGVRLLGKTGGKSGEYIAPDYTMGKENEHESD